MTLSVLCIPVLFGWLRKVDAENWPNWRGPAHNGSSSEINLPTLFSKEKNVRWVADLAGEGASTPCVWSERVFVTSVVFGEDAFEEGKLVMQCFDRKNGKLLWERSRAGRVRLDERSTTASPSPACDGKRVIFFFGTCDLFAFSLNGEPLWQKKLTPDAHYLAFLWTFASSPLLEANRVYLPILQRDTSFVHNGLARGEPSKTDNQSYLLCLDAATGEEIWRQHRPSEAVAESREAFGTVVPFTHDGVTQLLVAGGDCLTAHDPKNGREVWRWGTWNPERIGHWRLVPTPCPGAGLVVIPAPKKAPVYGVYLGGSGDLGEESLAWKTDPDEATSDVSSALFYEGRFYLVDGDRRDKALVCLDPADGKVIWRGALETRDKMEAAPTGGDGKIYMIDHGGKVFVARAGGSAFELLHQVEMGERVDEPIRSSVVAAGGGIFLRIGARLYHIGRE